MRYVIAASLLAVSVATAAAAQDAPPENLAGTLAGFRVEGNLGWDKTHSLGQSNDRFGYGGSAGFDGNLTNQIVIGPEVSYWRPSKNRNQTSVPGVNGGTVVHEGREMWAADIRIGYRVGPDLLVFGKGGYVNQAQRSYFNAPAGQQGYATRGRTDGYQVGGGVQFSPHDQFSFVPANVYLSAQYVYSDFNNHTRDEHAMAGIGFRFR
ncbi:outer membrane beta-barrel protein [Sphingomonas sp. AP4-R1]|uniref:outer membrane protein n=1 Tax=Sphingomonas sp. AP4-R1 TaxID=2735134 RepID=UPI0014938BE2|nr:outer membrane beta-barrel protein [Sphingomonas sp. AP4-R1]QJU60198.1 outer membrane beta-barrel protein [Sphingomonas sp. AP4-R1]